MTKRTDAATLLAIWAAVSLFALFGPQPVGLEGSAVAGWTTLSAAGLTLALLALAAGRSWTTRPAPLWVASAAWVVSIGALLYLQSSFVGSYAGESVVVGWQLTPTGQRHHEANPGTTVDEQLLDAGGEAEIVWTRTSILTVLLATMAAYACSLATLGLLAYLTTPRLTGRVSISKPAPPAATIPPAISPAPVVSPGAGGAAAQPRKKLFYSYAHDDEDLRDKLDNHLSSLRHMGILEPWHDRKIAPGSDWSKEIDVHLLQADIIVLLISHHFVASNYCYAVEMNAALKRHDDPADPAVVIPVVLRECVWQGLPFSKLQALPRGGKAVMTWTSMDAALTDVTEGIRRVALGLPVGGD
ncbi:MAG: TIR domain-containing protein [Acidobacteria bacterium]|nr:TIR domain-containing protein [Acidobacteriota bacterium]